MLIFLNPHAGSGRAREKWRAVEREVLARGDSMPLVLQDAWSDPVLTLREQIARGQRLIVAAGGDGTVHAVANALLEIRAEERKGVVLGAVGLGSSNDFHKPHGFSGVPLRLDHARAHPYNVCRCDYEDDHGRTRTEYFVANASLGILAAGNARFNAGGRMLRAIRCRSLQLTIMYCSMYALFRARNFGVTLKTRDHTAALELSNLSLLLNPHITGSYCYDTMVSPRSDHMRVNACLSMGPLQRIWSFYQLGRGRFSTLSRARSWACDEIELEPDAALSFEMDGEVRTARRIKTTLVRGAIDVCEA